VIERALWKNYSKKIMFILYFDRKYFRWAPVLIESIGISEPEENVCVYGIDLTGQQIEVLESYNVHYFEYSVDDRPVFSFEKRSRKFTDINRFKITNSKADFLLRSFEAFPEESLFIVMDVDCLIIRPLDELKKEMRRYDLAGLMKSRRVACGFKAVNPTDASKKMIKDWNDFLLDGHYYYNKDQLSFMEFYKKHEDEIKFLNLDHRYIDPQSKEDSYIWSAHKARFGSKDERFELYKRKLEELRVGC